MYKIGSITLKENLSVIAVNVEETKIFTLPDFCYFSAGSLFYPVTSLSSLVDFEERKLHQGTSAVEIQSYDKIPKLV